MSSIIYKHTQPGWVMRIILLILIPMNTLLSELGLTDYNPIPLSIIGMLLVFVCLFWSMTIQITHTHLAHWFGPYFWKKSYNLDEIKRVSISKSRWYNGYGIRFVGKGWMYNVSGKDRIEIHFQTGKVVYLGTDDATDLYSTMSEMIDENNT